LQAPRQDPAPYQLVLDEREAALADADQDVLQLKSAHDAAQAELDVATAERDRAKDADLEPQLTTIHNI